MMQGDWPVRLVLSRGDFTMEMTVPAEDAPGTAVTMMELVEDLAQKYPNILPHVEHVGGSHVFAEDPELFEEGRAGRGGRRVVGFHVR